MHYLYDLLLVVVGGAIGILSSITLDQWREIRKGGKARNAILTEIKINAKFLSHREYRHIQWQIYDLYLEHVSTFNKKQMESIIAFYAKLKRHQQLGDEYRIKVKENQNYQFSEDGQSKWSPLEEDITEIINLQKEILGYDAITI